MLKKFRQILNSERKRYRCRYEKHCGYREICRGPASGALSENTVTPLADTDPGISVRVFANSDIKTMEMGIYPGNIITVLHNDASERNIIVKIHDQRYIIPKKIAKDISVISSAS